jgi:hypothetical protein
MRLSTSLGLMAAVLAACGSAPAPADAQATAATTRHVPAAANERAPDLKTDWSIARSLRPAWGNGSRPGTYDPHEGAFRFVCGGDGKLAYDDPVVYPGQPGASHLHLAWGNEDFSAATTPETLAASPATNCNSSTFSVNRSLYWMPALVHDSGEVVRPDLVGVYYKRKKASSPFCNPGAREFIGICTGLPNQIRFIFGWDMTRPFAKVQGASWYCSGGDQRHYDNIDAVFAGGCKPGDILVANTVGQNCWDGENLDSRDHRSHMAYTDYRRGDGMQRCPASHPFYIPQEENKAEFTVTADMIGPDGRSRVRLASDHMLRGAKPGQTLHADYMEAWVAQAKALWVTHCIDKGLNCSGGEMGNGTQLVGADKPTYGMKIPKPRVKAPSKPAQHSGH